MTLTQDELSRRRSFVTASEVPCILGASDYRNAADVWYDKLGMVENSKPTAATDAGNRFEPIVREWAGEQLGGVVRGDWCVHHSGKIGATLDCMTLNREPVECKTSGLVSPGFPHKWGDEGTDEVPQEYLLQVHTQMLVVGAERGYIPAFLAGVGFRMYVFHRNDDLHAYILEQCERFLKQVENREKPAVIPHLETIKRIIRRPEPTVDVDVSLIEAYEAANEAAKAANKEKDRLQAELLASLGDAECGGFDGGKVTYLSQTRKAYSVEESSYRVMRIKRDKR